MCILYSPYKGLTLKTCFSGNIKMSCGKGYNSCLSDH